MSDGKAAPDISRIFGIAGGLPGQLDPDIRGTARHRPDPQSHLAESAVIKIVRPAALQGCSGPALWAGRADEGRVVTVDKKQ